MDSHTNTNALASASHTNTDASASASASHTDALVSVSPAWIAPKVEENATKTFKEVVPGVYTATPVRKIITKYGQQLIVKLESEDETCGLPSIEVYVPNSYVKLLLSTFDNEVNHVHLLNYKGSKEGVTRNKKKINSFDYQIAKLPEDQVVKLEMPVKEQEWKVAEFAPSEQTW